MRLYHGTNKDFEKIDLLKSKPNKDFGRGFYLSDNYEQALAMANIKLGHLNVGTPIVQIYEIDDTELNSLRVLRFDNYSEEWAKFILKNRNNSTDVPVHDFDLVIGPIADDRVGVQLWRFESNFIDLPTLVNNLKYMKGVTLQYFFGTERAINLLQRVYE